MTIENLLSLTTIQPYYKRKHPIFFMVIVFLFFVQTLSGFQRFPDYKFHTLSPEGGLSFDGVSDILQDKYGFVWVLLSDELYRFDGYTYKRYSTKLKKEIPNFAFNPYIPFVENRVGDLFLCSKEGVLRYHRKSDFFEEIAIGSVRNIYVDHRDNIWVVSGNGISIIDVEKKKLQLVEQQEGRFAEEKILFFSRGDELLMCKDKGHFFRFDYMHMRFKRVFSFPSSIKVLDFKKVGIYLWVLTEKDGLLKLNTKTRETEKVYTFFCKKNRDRRLPPARVFLPDKKGFIWIATQQGLYLLNPSNDKYVLYRHTEADKFSLTNNSVWNLKEDRQGNLWIGTYCGGICYVNFEDLKGFKTISVQSSKFSQNIISAFAERGNQLWIGTEGSGVLCFDRSRGVSTSFEHEVDKNSLAYDNVKALLMDSIHHKLWIGMFRGGLDCLDLKTNSFKNYSEYEADKRILINHVNRLEAEADSGIWVGYRDGDWTRMTYFSITRNVSKHYYFKSKEYKKFVGTAVSDFCRDDKNSLWIGSQERLHVMNVKTKEIHAIPIDTLHRKDLKSLNIQTLFWNKLDQSVWIGTNGFGLIQYDTKVGKFFYFSDILRFNVHSIYSIIADKQNNLWLGADNGLFKFDRNRKYFFQYDKNDGLQGREFYPHSSLNSNTGELYFGGTEGFSIVNPQSIVSNPNKPIVVLSDFFVDNKVVSSVSPNSPLKEAIYLTNHITLNHNQSNFGFEFSSTNFLMPEKTRFKYRLKGYDNNYVEVDASHRYASYAKVPAGKYKFEVLATNNDGVWSDTPKTVEVTILPAPWLTWWAFLFYFVLIALTVYFILHYYIAQKKLGLELYLETTEMKRQEENHQLQLQFFTNISHDFKTPLSLILGTLERLKQESAPISERYMASLANNAKRLLNLINELMDFRLVENGKRNLEISCGDLNEFIRKQTSDFEEYAIQRNIDFQIVLDPELDNQVWFDRKIAEKVMMNLLNNAFKYTTGGSITVKTFADVSSFNSNYRANYKVAGSEGDLPMFGVVIQDTGIGISEKSIRKIFDRFYMVNDPQGEQHLGSGIGLALVKSLVLLHKGTISIGSEKGVGTDIAVAFPVSRQVYAQSEFTQADGSENSVISTDGYQIEKQTDIESDSEKDSDEFLQRETKRILLVEDNDELRVLISETLSMEYDICEADNGVTATALMDDNEVDLIVSDLMMPQKDGITFCKEIKNDVSTSHIPFIMITAKSGLENHIEGVYSGADAYLEKPVNLKLLSLTIQNLFKQQNRIKEFYAKNFYSDSSELKVNKKDNDFMKLLVKVIDEKIDQSEMDINYLTGEMSMSRTKLYAKVKALTGKSIVEFVRYYRMRKAAHLLVEENLPIQDVMNRVGIDTQSYFTRVFKQEFGKTPTAFIASAKKK